MKTVRHLVAIAALIWSAVNPVVAQEISPEHLGLAKKYVAMTDVGSVFQRTILATAQNSIDHLVQQNPDVGEAIVIAAREIATSYLEGDNLLHENFARIYASRYSMAELQEIITFYETPVGQKMLANKIAITGNLHTAARLLEDNINTEFIARLRVNLKEKGFDT